MKGLLIINKKSGVSSSSVVVKVKKMLSLKKVGHMGTLDPLASGVLILGVGKATRLFDSFLKKKKRYLATFEFGKQTDTLDLEGSVVNVSNIIPTEEEIQGILPSFLGVQDQIPPKFSSKKIDGRRAYDLVRSGKEADLKPCKIEIYDICLEKKLNDKTYVFDINCSGGTYIRSIARDLGKSLGTCATMVNLIRTECGKYTLDDCVNLDDIKENLEKSIVPLKNVLEDYDKIYINDKFLKDILDGKKVFVDRDDFLTMVKGQVLECGKEYSLICKDEIVGLCNVDEQRKLNISTFLYG